MLRFAEHELGVRFLFLDNFPDYRQDLRSDGRHLYTMQEYEDWGAFICFPWVELEARRESGHVAKGHALVSMLLNACLQSGVDLADGTEIRVTDGVVLAAGGFEWDHALADSMLATRLFTMCSPPSNTGDALRMAQRIGAMTRGTREAWWAPMSPTGTLRDGEPMGTLLRFERQGPGSIMVNRHGRRFANETQNYNDLARVLHSRDSADNQALNTPREPAGRVAALQPGAVLITSARVWGPIVVPVGAGRGQGRPERPVRGAAEQGGALDLLGDALQDADVAFSGHCSGGGENQAHGRHHVAVVIEHRYGHGASSRADRLHGAGVAPVPDLLELRVQFARIGQSVLGEGLELPLQVGLPEPVLLVGQEDLSDRSGMQGQATAHG